MKGGGKEHPYVRGEEFEMSRVYNRQESAAKLNCSMRTFSEWAREAGVTPERGEDGRETLYSLEQLRTIKDRDVRKRTLLSDAEAFGLTTPEAVTALELYRREVEGLQRSIELLPQTIQNHVAAAQRTFREEIERRLSTPAVAGLVHQTGRLEQGGGASGPREKEDFSATPLEPQLDGSEDLEATLQKVLGPLLLHLESTLYERLSRELTVGRPTSPELSAAPRASASGEAERGKNREREVAQRKDLGPSEKTGTPLRRTYERASATSSRKNPSDLPMWTSAQLFGENWVDPQEGHLVSKARMILAHNVPDTNVRRDVEQKGDLTMLPLKFLFEGVWRRGAFNSAQRRAFYTLYSTQSWFKPCEICLLNEHKEEQVLPSSSE